MPLFCSYKEPNDIKVSNNQAKKKLLLQKNETVLYLL